MSDKSKSPAPTTGRLHGGGRTSSAGKSRLAALAPGEHIKEKQQKLKEEREAKRAQLDERHVYILVTVADSLGIDRSEVEDAILEGNQIEKIHKFLEANGSSYLMFFYQEPEPDKDGVEHLRLGPGGQRTPRSGKPRVFVSTGKEVALRGTALVFLRPQPNIAITDLNIAKEVNFLQLDASGSTNGHGLLHSIENVMSSLFLPSLRSLQSGWGHLETPDGLRSRTDFLNTLDTFVSVIVGAEESLTDRVSLAPCDTYELNTIKGHQDYISIANSTEALQCIEDCIQVWIRQIEQVLAESEQMRREADDIGPRAELDHWKKRMSRFNYLLEQIKGDDVKVVLGVLTVARSKTLKKWQELDRRITDVANEAKDNVKYLYTLEKFTDPLYNSDPVGMLDCIPGLINAIRMIHSISRYYNTSERMTSLFVKITNQMITACKAYITVDATETVWSQPTDQVIKKLQDCIHLNKEYQECFKKTKARLEEMPHERKFEFSEMYIFGKFDTFTRRLKKIIDMFQTMEMYSHLHESKIEGMELMANKFQVIVTSMRKKPYNCIDQRKMEFDTDFDEFKRQIVDLHTTITTFMDQRFERIVSTQRALAVLHKFETLNLPNLGIQEKYQKILSHYARDIEMVSKIYQKNKSDPPIARDLPPIAGKIAWARQLFHRIQEPMDAFQQHAKILQGSETKKIVKNYNKLAKVLLEFEVLFHRVWLRQVDVAKSGLSAALLVQHQQAQAETKELFVNLDPQILTLVRETECMSRLGLEVPHGAKQLRAKQDDLKDTYNKLSLMLVENARVRSRIPAAFQQLMEPHLQRVDKAIEPGIVKLTWTSITIEDYVLKVHNSLAELDLLVKRTNDIVEFRIDAVLRQISTTVLCELPEEEPWTPEHFLERTQALCAKGAQIIQVKSINVENAANELISILCDANRTARDELDEDDSDSEEEEGEVKKEDTLAVTPDPSRSRPTSMHSHSASIRPTQAEMLAKRRREYNESMEEAATELLAYFNHKNLDALLKVTRNTLESMKKRITSSSMVHYLGDIGSDTKRDHRPFFYCDAVLAIPSVVMHPALDEVQQTVNRASQSILSVAKGVSQWSKERRKMTPKSLHAAPTTALLGEPPLDRRGSMSSMPTSETSRSDLDGGMKGEGEEKTVTFAIRPQAKNYFRNVSDNKDIAKLVSLLFTAINSTKKSVLTALEKFSIYAEIWCLDRDEELQIFMKDDPRLTEFEAKILHYKELEQQIVLPPSI